MVEAAQMVVDRWEAQPPDQPVNMMYEMRQITQSVIVQAMFSTSISREETIRAGEALDYALLTLVERSITPFSMPEWLPTARNRRLREALATLDEVVYRFIDERRALVSRTEDGYDPTGDLLSMLINVRYEDTGEGMSDQQLRDEVMTMFLAGHETTANTLTWVWYLLSQHPEIEARLHAELDDVLGGRAPTFADLDTLAYTRMVIEETLRMYPAVWMTGRQSIEEDVIGGYTIPADSMLMLSFYFMHHDPTYWDEPEVFRPERFSEGGAQDRPRWAYLPFGGGPRVCIGQHFALMEAQLVLALIAQRYAPRLVPGQPIDLRLMGTLQPKEGPWMLLERR
jgi:cytochrome P450